MLKPGDTLGVYRIVRLLDSGGMGSVYVATCPTRLTPCALKVFSTSSAQRDFLRTRFLVEGRLLETLDNPHVVHVFDVQVEPKTQLPYFAMDLVLAPDGQPRTLEQARKSGVSEAQAEMWFRDLCQGLAYIHSKGVVHRDISLENVMIGPTGHAVITDFGVSRIFDNKLRKQVDLAHQTMTELGMVPMKMGKTPYLAPELLRIPPAKASPSTDAWALGILLFRLLTGFWFEVDNRENAFDMLEGMDLPWSRVLSALLNEKPSSRLPSGSMAEIPRLLEQRSACPFWLSARGGIVGGVCLLLVLGVVGVWYCLRTKSTEINLHNGDKTVTYRIEYDGLGPKAEDFVAAYWWDHLAGSHDSFDQWKQRQGLAARYPDLKVLKVTRTETTIEKP